MAAREDEECGALLHFAVLLGNAVNEAADDDSVDFGKAVALALAGWPRERVMAAWRHILLTENLSPTENAVFNRVMGRVMMEHDHLGAAARAEALPPVGNAEFHEVMHLVQHAFDGVRDAVAVGAISLHEAWGKSLAQTFAAAGWSRRRMGAIPLFLDALALLDDYLNLAEDLAMATLYMKPEFERLEAAAGTDTFGNA